MKRLFGALLLVICLSLVAVSWAPMVLADRGMVPITDVTVYGPGQKAIIAWDGKEEILILSTDVRASSDSQVLELLPLPSKPQIEKGDFVVKTTNDGSEVFVKDHHTTPCRKQFIPQNDFGFCLLSRPSIRGTATEPVLPNPRSH